MDEDLDAHELYHIEQSQSWDEEYFSDFEEFSPDDTVSFSDDSDNENTADGIVVIVSEKKSVKTFELSNKDRAHIAQTLSILGGGRLHAGGKSVPRGAIANLAKHYKVNRSTIHRIWADARIQLAKGNVVNVENKKKGRCGRKAKGFDLELLQAIPIEKRTTIRALAEALGISHSTVYRLLKSGQLRAHTNSIKPGLRHHHKKQRVDYILQSIIPGNIRRLPKFSAMYNIVHIDEKWFFMSQETQMFYSFPWESDPYRSCQSKRFISKVMFLAGIATPHVKADGEVLWDGKIAIFPFTEDVPAQRSSKNRERGTIETKAINSITQPIIISKLIEELLPAIIAKWPVGACKDIWIQQDNARPHTSPNDPHFIHAATKDGFNIQLINQPAQSPDLNVLDLGFFRAIQSIQYKSFPKTVTALVKAVTDAYSIFEPKCINYTWLQLQYCMVEILQVKGGNNYKNPHHGKKRLERLGLLPNQVEVPQQLLDASLEFLHDGYFVVNDMEAINIDNNVP
ncbi:hypothetical protein OROMI_026458 [Orobanche minor]